MKLREYLRPELVMLDLAADDVHETIRRLVDTLRERGVVSDAERLERALLEREAVHTTAMGSGVAVPHATLPDLERTVVMIAVAPRGVRFGPVGLDPVRLFFVVLSPRDGTGNHIKLLARIARLVRHPGFVEQLVGSPSVTALLDAFEHVDAGHV